MQASEGNTNQAVAEEIDLDELEEILEKYSHTKGALIPALQAVQEKYGYLPEQAMDRLSEALNIPLAKIYGVATFYAQFYLHPRGRNILKICDGTACHVGGASELVDVVRDRLSIEDGETTPDRKVTLEVIYCLGSCGLAPVMVVNDRVIGRLQPDDVHKVLDKLE